MQLSPTLSSTICVRKGGGVAPVVAPKICLNGPRLYSRIASNCTIYPDFKDLSGETPDPCRKDTYYQISTFGVLRGTRVQGPDFQKKS